MYFWELIVHDIQNQGSVLEIEQALFLIKNKRPAQDGVVVEAIKTGETALQNLSIRALSMGQLPISENAVIVPMYKNISNCQPISLCPIFIIFL